MRNICMSLLCIGFFIVGGLTTFAAEKPETDGFTSLFNGKDLTGWKVKGGDSLAGKVEVKDKRFQIVDQLLVIDGKKRGNLVIETEKVFEKDVLIQFEFLPDNKCNNDLYFRGNKFDIKKGGVKNLEPGKWHLFEIVVKGKTVEFKCNGQIQRTGKVKKPTPLGLRAEFGAISFRNIRYKE